MKIVIVMIGALFASLGCARIKVEAPKEPIKMDISMRLDIYQHVAKDIDDIEDMVSGSPKQAKPNNSQSRFDFFLPNAYAQEGLSPEVEAAVNRRKQRRSQLLDGEQKGIVGENSLGAVVIRDLANADASLTTLVNDENNDRMAIYQAVSQKNGASLDEVQKLYAKKLQDNAPAGTLIEVLNQSIGQYEWVNKK